MILVISTKLLNFLIVIPAKAGIHHWLTATMESGFPLSRE
jgi:hypothetical protein